jgi:hypothetical protein
MPADRFPGQTERGDTGRHWTQPRYEK